MAFYGYPNTRVRGMKSRLLNRTFFEQLLEAEDNEEVINLLSKTDYRKDIEEGIVKFPGTTGIEEGLKLNITRDYQKILNYIKGNGQAERLVKILLSRWDVHNLKTIFRGIHSEAPKEEIKDQLMPVAQLDQAHLNLLVEQDDIKACIDLLAMWGFNIAYPLTEVYSEYQESNKLSTLELVIDKQYFKQMASQISKLTLSPRNERLVKEYVQREVDFVNIMTLLRLIREGVKHVDSKTTEVIEEIEEKPEPSNEQVLAEVSKKAIPRFKKIKLIKTKFMDLLKSLGIVKKKKEVKVQQKTEEETDAKGQSSPSWISDKDIGGGEINYNEIFIPGGKDKALKLKRCISLLEEPEIEDVIDKLKDSSYYPVLQEGLKRYHFTGALSALERKIEDHIIKELVKLFKDDPLSIAIIMAFIWAKFNETVNLRIIVRGKDVEMPEDQIKEALVLV